LTPTPLAGEPLLDGRYQLRRRLGQGGMGVVYKARHIFLKTTHAIKIILPELVGGDQEFLTRFRQEAMAAAAIRHQNVIAVTDYGVIHETTPFLVMEYVQGRTLHDILAEKTRLGLEQALEIMRAVGAGVAAAHRRGIVHRDLKPLNIMIEDDQPIQEGVKVLDFGLAKIKSGELLGSFVAAKTTGLMGSPFYMAPELWSEEEPEKEADIYSLGVIFYQMLAGDVPFKGPSVPVIMRKHLMEPPPRFAELGAAVPAAVEEVVRRALEKEPDQRPQTALDFVNELNEAVSLNKTSPDMPAVSTRALNLTQDQFASTIAGVQEADLLSADRGREERRRFAEEESRQWDNIEAQRAAREEGRRREAEEAALTNVPSVQEPVGAGEAAPDSSSMTLVGVSDATRVNAPSKETVAVEAGRDVPSQAKPKKRQTVIQIPESGASREAGKRPLLWKLIGGIAVLAVLAFAGVMIYRSVSSGASTKQQPPVTTQPAKEQPPVTDASGQILIQGGSFQMGRGDVPPNIDSLSPIAQQWFYVQWPAHEVAVKSFYIDRTEVTNAEYAQFVAATGYAAPKGKAAPTWTPWDGNNPPAGQEQWPVRNVSLDDVKAFAAWRSERDHLSYRLPTEEEWEYAARSRGKNQPYPWGDQWEDGRANLETKQIHPVGAHPKGRTEQGVDDMIGNVWEWTSSPITIRNNRMIIPKGNENHIVIRGGSSQSQVLGDEAITATARKWVPPDTRDPNLGFRLVREAPEQ
jgi:serine/threonine-protein kinase